MKTLVSKTLFAFAILSFPLAGTAMAGPSAQTGIQTAQSGGVPAECASITDAEERAACIREKQG